MKNKKVNLQTGRVMSEGDELYYEVRGQGEPLLMIPPAGGDGWHYSLVADILADEYKVILYDRRANARSTINNPQNFEISQQSRDAVAVLKAVGEKSASVFGLSSGAVIALDVAKNHPQAVRKVIVHEPPIPRVLPEPEAEKWRRFFAKVYLTAFRFGSSLAAFKFFFGIKMPAMQMIKATKDVNKHRAENKEIYIDEKVTTEFMIKHELLPVTNYMLDVDKIKKDSTKIYMAVGEWSKKRNTWYAQTAKIVAGKLDCELITFPGHHGSYMDMPEEFAATLRNLLQKI